MLPAHPGFVERLAPAMMAWGPEWVHRATSSPLARWLTTRVAVAAPPCSPIFVVLAAPGSRLVSRAFAMAQDLR